VRKSDKPFGGIQVIITGDLLQLLPVFKILFPNEKNSEVLDTRLIIESDIFNEIFTKENTIVFCKNFRQENDTEYMDILSRVRIGTFTKEDVSILESRKIAPLSKDILQLVSSNKKAQSINTDRLSKLPEPSMKFDAKYEMSDNSPECAYLYNELFSQFKTKEMNNLVFKIGCRVMLIRNIDTEKGLVNGATGNIVSFTGAKELIVKFDNGITHTIGSFEWKLDISECTAKVTQVPLILAYAITCHKSQSLTLDSAYLDLSDAFCDHMVYVALSRLKSINGLYLKSFDAKKITVNEKMKAYLELL
jgi:ATP-dependent DNA helicase PIF1